MRLEMREVAEMVQYLQTWLEEGLLVADSRALAHRDFLRRAAQADREKATA